MKDIEDELLKIENDNLLERTNYLKDNLKTVNEVKDVKMKYIEIIKLLIRDNTILSYFSIDTYKDLIEEYLLFIKKNEDELKTEFKSYFEEFNNEKETYSPFFDDEEFENKFEEQRGKSEKKKYQTFLIQ